jgi:hypothetical protein
MRLDAMVTDETNNAGSSNSMRERALWRNDDAREALG